MSLALACALATHARDAAAQTFTDITAGLEGVISGSVAWGDYDNDGDLDVLLTGYSTSGPISKVYRNSGGANPIFTDIAAALVGVSNSSVTWGDKDNDGDLDILQTGWWESGYLARIYRSDGAPANAPPPAPGVLRVASDQTTGFTFSWSGPFDDHSASVGLTYNLRVGTTPGGNDLPRAAVPGCDGSLGQGSGGTPLKRLPTLLPHGKFASGVSSVTRLPGDSTRPSPCES